MTTGPKEQQCLQLFFFSLKHFGHFLLRHFGHQGCQVGFLRFKLLA